MIPLGTSISLPMFFQDLRSAANFYEQTTLTHTEYTNFDNKLCSYSHISTQYGVSWNECIYRAGLKIKKDFKGALTGRKPKENEFTDMINCLSCDEEFGTVDRVKNRICISCKKKNENFHSW